MLVSAMMNELLTSWVYTAATFRNMRLLVRLLSFTACVLGRFNRWNGSSRLTASLSNLAARRQNQFHNDLFTWYRLLLRNSLRVRYAMSTATSEGSADACHNYKVHFCFLRNLWGVRLKFQMLKVGSGGSCTPKHANNDANRIRIAQK